MSLRAMLNPMEAATERLPAKDIPTEAAPTLAVMSVVSSALRAMLLAEIPDTPSLSIYAFTSAAILFSATAPAPTRLTAKSPVAPTPNAPAPTSAVIVSSAVAVWLNAPVAVMLEFSI